MLFRTLHSARTLRAATVGVLLVCHGAAEAGDILRGGAGVSNSRTSSGGASGANAGARAAAAAKARANDQLARTTQAVQAVKAMQRAARAAAQSGANHLGRNPNRPGQNLRIVPDGLGRQGLHFDNAIGATAPVQTGDGNGTTVTVEQKSAQALLNWKKFNVGKKTTLKFDQSAGGQDRSQWIAFNRVTDRSGEPSQILGSIKADGQVYVINQNGIIFGGSSQVNVHALVASSLPINDGLVNRGLLNNPDAQFLFSALAMPEGARGTPAFKPPTVFTQNGRRGDVVVQAGAELTSPTTAAGSGGRIALVGANVRNEGTISTPDGQTILAAGLQVGFAPHPGNDPSLRGLDVYVGNVGSYAGTATNTGLIDAPRASVVMTGKTVQQLGAIDSTTSVSLNGRVDLLADFGAIANPPENRAITFDGGLRNLDPYLFLPRHTGTVTLGEGSVTRILPETGDATVVGTALPLQSRVNVQGRIVAMDSGASILAPNANVRLSAGRYVLDRANPEQPVTTFVYSTGSIDISRNARIDVSGATDVQVALEQSILTLQLRGAELADSPLQRLGLLRAIDLTVDLRDSGVFNGIYWMGTPLGDATGFAGLIRRTALQLSTAGGSVELKAGQSVSLNEGSLIDVSGGYSNYEGGSYQTTRVFSGGQLIDIADATPDRIYDGIYTGKSRQVHEKWGISRTFVNPLAPTARRYSADYVGGADGGSIAITAPTQLLQGQLSGATIAGPRQVRDSANSSALASPGQLALTFRAQEATGPNYFLTTGFVPKIVFESGEGAMASSRGGVSEIQLSSSLLTSGGFGSLTVDNSGGDIVIPESVSLVAREGGTIKLSAANLSILGDVKSPGGALDFTAYNISPYLAEKLKTSTSASTPPANVGRGQFLLGAGATLDAAGLVTDDRDGSAPPIALAGGKISISAYAAQLAAGSTIDVSGGVLVPANDKPVRYGDAGAIAIKSGQDPTFTAVLGGELELGADLRGYSGAKGGSLTVQTSLIQVGGTAPGANTLLLAPEFFGRGGFTSFTLNALGDRQRPDHPSLTIAPGTILAPVVENIVAEKNPAGGGGVAISPLRKPDGLRTAVSLSFGAPGVRDSLTGGLVLRGDLVVGRDASVEVEPLGKVAFRGDTVSILGSVTAPGGEISVTGSSDSTAIFDERLHALTTVYLGSESALSTAGALLLQPDPFGRRTGSVLPGGTISVSGNLFAESGSSLDVSGASGMLDIPPSLLDPDASGIASATSGLTAAPASVHTVPVRVDSDGGTITLDGGQLLVSNAALRGAAGGPAALGGALAVSSGRFYPEGATASPLDVTLAVRQGDLALLPVSPGVGGRLFLGSGGALAALGYFAADQFQASGLDSLSLDGVVAFEGPVNIAARRELQVATGGVLYADSRVELSAPHVSLGTPFQSPAVTAPLKRVFEQGGEPFFFAPKFGAGELTVRAKLIDVGNLSLQGIGKAGLFADGGDIRGNGTFNIEGDLTLRAGQIYPVSAASFTVVAYDHALGAGSVTIAASGDRPLPISAGGTLGIYAQRITQGGVLRAPMGTINLGWDGIGAAPTDLITGSKHAFPVTQLVTLGAGSVTSVSGVDADGNQVLFPYGSSTDGNSFIDPTGKDIAASGVATKNVSISGATIDAAADSVIDLRGGGDLYASRWVSGNGGSRDLLGVASQDWSPTTSYDAGALVRFDGATWSARQSNSGEQPTASLFWSKVPESYAIVPGYEVNYAPYTPFAGSFNEGLAVGDRVYLGAGAGVPKGVYTLLPARFALLPGAILVTPQDGPVLGPTALPGGASVVSGYRFNDLDRSRSLSETATRFEVAPASVVRASATYEDYFANTFLRQRASELDVRVSRLPIDAGHLVLNAGSSMVLDGSVLGAAPRGGRGANIDISSSGDILITAGGATSSAGQLVLDAARLNGFGAESLLIGGVRTVGADGAEVVAKTGNLLLDNAGTPLFGPEIILVSNESLTLAAGAQILQRGEMGGPAEVLKFGNAAAGSGNGALVRVSSDFNGASYRIGVSDSASPALNVGAGVQLSGASLTLDSTAATSLDASAILNGRAIALNSGQIVIELDDAGVTQPTRGVVLTGGALDSLSGAQKLSLLSYSSIDFYGHGVLNVPGELALQTGEIRGFNNGGGRVQVTASSLLLENPGGSASPGATADIGGTLEFNAGVIRVGANTVAIDQFAQVALNASNGILLQDTGSLVVQNDLALYTPLLTAAPKTLQTIKAGGHLLIQDLQGGRGGLTAGLGAEVALVGASVTSLSTVYLPSGILSLTATTGDLNVGGRLDVGGTSQTFYDLVRYSSGGRISLGATNGNVNLLPGSLVDVSAQPDGGHAGYLAISAPKGSVVFDGDLAARAGSGGLAGSFSLDVGQLPALSAINDQLNAADFTFMRNIRVRTGDVVIDGLALSRNFRLSADQGSITVTGTIDASGATGGSIALSAHGSLTLLSGSRLTVAGADFNNAGKGGDVTLEAGSQSNGVIDSDARLSLQAGAVIDLSVASSGPGDQAGGLFSGTLHLRAPQLADASDIRIDAIDATIRNASSILIEGYRLYDLTGTDGDLTAVQAEMLANGNAFLSGAGATVESYYAMLRSRLLANNTALASITVYAPGAEIINRSGNLVLGAEDSDEFTDWDLSVYRFGPTDAPGVLTMRASGDLVFYNALSDGFSRPAGGPLYRALLMEQNELLPTNVQSWSFRLAAGADLAAADFRGVLALSELAPGTGSLKLGKDNGANSSDSNDPSFPNSPGDDAITAFALENRYQVIRTGTGSIDIATGRDIQLLNQFATIYTAGVQVKDPTMGGTFDVPNYDGSDGVSRGASQQDPAYPVQYSLAGGNVSLNAQGDIGHYTLLDGELVADSGRELPNNWLYRRGFVDPSTGEFGLIPVRNNTGTPTGGDIASTTWWVDFSNFFQGVGALGGGNVSLVAGGDVSNVDAVVPTNARMPKGRPDAGAMVELGGGDLVVRAGHDIDGGVYYVERGQGTLVAGNQIKTNSTRSPTLSAFDFSELASPSNWLPTTLFLGKGSFDVSARGDVLLGPVSNPFLLPSSVNNLFWYKTYFSTYAPDSSVNATSLGGSVTLRQSATPLTDGSGAADPLLFTWLNNVQLLSSESVAFYQPWLRLSETSVLPFATMASLLPPTLRATSFSQDVNVVGDLTLVPSARGTIELAAAASINALQPNGVSAQLGTTWGYSRINLSDADPSRLPGIATPYAYQSVVGTVPGLLSETGTDFLKFIDALFAESGSSQGEQAVIETKQTLHAPGLLHAGDPDPVRLYASSGSISGLTLFSPKAARILAGEDVTDIALYVQNLSENDVTVVSSGRDIIAYSANSPLRAAATAAGNVLNNSVVEPAFEIAPALAGDIQINGPGALEVLAGRNLDLGTGSNNADGTGTGITSIGNARNPYLPFSGADVFAGAGIGPSSGLADSSLEFDAFIKESLTATQIQTYAAELGVELDGGSLEELPLDARNRLALQMFYLVLRDAGRDFNTPGRPGFGTYDAGFAAIEALFASRGDSGDINTRARDIRTRSGGDISIFAPAGGLTLATSVVGTPAAPPGIITESGGNISIFTHDSVDIGISRIFTLRGGNEIIWSSAGDIAAGASSKTVKSAPPTRVLLDPQSADVQTDLAGLATGGGIGVLATVPGLEPGDVDLIAPTGVIDAGDAGIRSSGNLNIAAVQVLNASNITASGQSIGVPSAPVVAAPNIAGLTAASNATGATTNAASDLAREVRDSDPLEETLSVITAEVLGYGGE